MATLFSFVSDNYFLLGYSWRKKGLFATSKILNRVNGIFFMRKYSKSSQKEEFLEHRRTD